MLRIGICDDDPHMLNYLSALCTKILPEAVITEYRSGMEILSSAGSFEIILMDVRMEGMDGLNVIKRLQSRISKKTPNFPSVIFITAYDEYVFEALDLFPFHYLLKPLDEEKFERVLKRAAEKHAKKEKEEAVFFHTKTRHLHIYPSDIYFVESNLRKAIINLEHAHFEVYSTMAELEKLFGNSFFRCHRGYLVNLGKVQSYDRETITLVNGTRLILTKTKYAEFVDAYMRYLKINEG
ncbi:LytR/AlgR family response regulator transcription factor [Clostridium transplantifaecale]|uniref:LytR/AlgR family response regulator transcription factor n=1 Tax=Clostridium transplantifaecale TaxID=2479838 RepID=UPI000F64509B|nr:LytTR family DNA-binding domain-containing protein [Clostridium transplantifaecale]